MDQSAANSGIPQAVFDQEFAIATMNQVMPTPVTLSQLKNLYERPHAGRIPIARAVRTLSTPQRVNIDNNFMVPATSPDLGYSSTLSHVDALIMVPNTIGLDALLPVFPPDQGYALQLQLGQRTKPFRGKSPRLGFNPKQSLLYVGRCRRDDVWVAFADTLPEEAPLNTQPIRGRLKDTVMPRAIHNMLLLFFAYSLSIASVGDICIHGNDYPADIENDDCIQQHTNLM